MISKFIKIRKNDYKKIIKKIIIKNDDWYANRLFNDVDFDFSYYKLFLMDIIHGIRFKKYLEEAKKEKKDFLEEAEKEKKELNESYKESRKQQKERDEKEKTRKK